MGLSSGLEGISVSKTDDDGMELGSNGNRRFFSKRTCLLQPSGHRPFGQSLGIWSALGGTRYFPAGDCNGLWFPIIGRYSDSSQRTTTSPCGLIPWKNCRCPKSPCRVILLKSWISAGTSWKAVYQVQPGDSGEVSFTIDYKDLASNEGIQKTGDDLSNKMVIDTQLPTVLTTGISIQSSNTIAAVDGLKWARKDENIKLIFNTSEHVFSPKVNIAGVEVNAVPRDSDTTGTQWEATYRVENILGDLLESTNLVLRLDASNIDGNRNRAFSEGDQISNWMDLSSKGYTLNRSHNLRPTFSSTGMNGKPAVQFNGNSNLYVENFNSLSTDDYTILVVSQLASASGHQDLLSITKSDHGLLLKSSGGKWRFLHRMPIANSGGSTAWVMSQIRTLI